MRGKRRLLIHSLSQTKYAHYLSYEYVISICQIYNILSNFKYDLQMEYLELLFLPISRNRYGYIEQQKSIDM
mgnify:CR=1 FL=1